MWIEPKTGQIIDQEQHDVRAANGTPLLDVELSFTDSQVKTNVDDAKSNVSSLDLITSTVPLIGFILGPILLIAGAIGLVLSRRSERGPTTREHDLGCLRTTADRHRPTTASPRTGAAPSCCAG